MDDGSMLFLSLLRRPPAGRSMVVLENGMRKALLPVALVALFSTLAYAQKEPKEYPWERTMRRIEADEAKAPQSKKEDKKPEKKARTSEKRIESKHSSGE
jgi:hypothetical protein